MLRLLLVLLRPPPLCPARQRWASPRVAPPLRRCAFRLVPCASALGSAAVLRPLPPRCWVQKRPPQSSQKLWGGRLFAVASFALRLVPCASALGSAAVLRRCAFRLVPCASALGFAAVLSLGFAAVLSPCFAAVLRRFALRLVPCALALGFAAGLSPGSAASVFGSGCRYASSLENSSKEISFLSSVTTSFSAVISLRSAAWLTNWSACSGFFSISSA